ncbi:hypothetical protein [Arcicella lustrica]|uniref:Uncharacterized protein n=1 Tax=Arcicella lustrica TaxID=2984196 RepID=A0ABU5SP95_9BACT|nr:hypothetical protein [Arcicella sp. DC25W]MEA5429090.1 hypothetical protein [Arcicella sp. DC25W]
MKTKLLFILLPLTFCFNTFAQKKKPAKKTPAVKVSKIDSTELLNKNPLKAGVQQAKDFVEASLSPKDLTANQNGEKRYYDSYKLLLHAGEELFLEHSSANFRVMLSLKTPAKDKQELSYDSQPFKGNSINKFHYVAPVTGTYTLLATSMDAGQLGKYKIAKTITTASAIESGLDQTFANQFKALEKSKKENFKNITGEKIKKDKKEEKKDKTAGLESFKTNLELVSGKNALIFKDNNGQTANYKSVLFESESEEEVKANFEQLKKQLQVLTRNWTEQSNTDTNYSSSTDTDFITLKINSIPPVKKKQKPLFQLEFVYN